MASVSTNRSEKSVVLTESDIPGAKIPRDSLMQCSVPQLKRWLLCRGAKTTGKKAVLIERIKDYQTNGLDKKYLRDPDGGINLLKKKAHLGVLENTEPTTSSFPKEGFTCDLNSMPKLTFGTIWRFMIDTVECRKQLSTAKPLVKGYNFYKSGHVLFISHLRENGKHYVKSKVLPSMKKHAVYTCCIVLSSAGNVLRANCGCPAGIDGRCNHVAATLFSLEQLSKVQQEQNKESCTSKPCKWNVPRKRVTDVQPLGQMKFTKHDYNKVNKKKRHSILLPGHDVRADHQKEWSDDKVKNMFNLVKAYQDKSGNKVGWLHILPQECDDNTDPATTSETATVVNAKSDEYDTCIISPLKVQPPSQTDIKERCEKIKQKLQLNQKEIDDAEESTKGQSNNSAWYALRKYRITASQCHRVATLRESTNPTKAIQQVLMMNNTFQSQSMKEGLEMEDNIIKEYIIEMEHRGHTGITVSKCGFMVCKEKGFLGASPDGLVHDPTASQPEGLIEVKFIQLKDDESLNDSLVRKRICTNKDGVCINNKHQYYYQIQQQMSVTKRKWTDFVVQGSHSSDIFCQRVEFLDSFWEVTFAKLQRFYDRYIAPEIAYPRIRHGLNHFDYRFE